MNTHVHVSSLYHVYYMYVHVCTCIPSQVERTSSEKAISAAVAEEREKYDKIIADMKVKMHHFAQCMCGSTN